MGGQGPAATAYFLQRLVERTEASCDQDHIRTLAFNDTAIPDRTAFILGRGRRSPAEALAEDGLLLEACGCDLLALPCNTAHSFYDELQRRLHAPIIHMVRETVVAASRAGARRIGVLATLGTAAANLYGREAAALGMECAYPGPATQHAVNRLVFDYVKAGVPVSPGKLGRLTAPLADAGCDVAILGCTELSFAFGGESGQSASALPVIDALDVLVNCIIERTGHVLRCTQSQEREILIQ